ncbi:hypothetical protein RND81_07G026900 [Saponaria officinalis]|uniref:Myb-like domain-containing protein n=1 Tax=Saponaria officinalis TaxID=3572 RepID=A0AAW1JL86_SAPOF
MTGGTRVGGSESECVDIYRGQAQRSNLQVDIEDEDKNEGGEDDEDGEENEGEGENEKGGATKPKTNKSKVYWSVEEDTALISGWCHYTLDKVQGTYQTRGSMWGNIFSYVKDKCPNISASRNMNSCRNRWGKIAKCVCKYIGALSGAEARKSSGMSKTDILVMANEIYSADGNGDFTMTYGYELLKNEPKFLTLYGCKKKEDIYSFESNLNKTITDENSKRLRLNDGGAYSSSTNPSTPNSNDPPTPQFPPRPSGEKAAKGKGVRVQKMQNLESLEEQIN